MKKRVLAALLVTMMTVGTVAGCGSNAKSDDSDKKASSESKSDDKKDSGKKVTVVTSGTGDPYSLPLCTPSFRTRRKEIRKIFRGGCLYNKRKRTADASANVL